MTPWKDTLVIVVVLVVLAYLVFQAPLAPMVLGAVLVLGIRAAIELRHSVQERK